MRSLLITIDGPAGAGKTTVAKLLADSLSYTYIDTGALYRTIGLAAYKKGIDVYNDKELEKLCKKSDIKLEHMGESLKIILNGKDVTKEIREPQISMMASRVSACPEVRKFLLGFQKKLGEKKRAVFEGRDMGTVVFPDADMKFFLDASVEERAKRRYEELKGKISQTFLEIKEDIKKRDKNDSTRKIAPLKKAEDAILIDSTGKSAKEVVRIMLSHIEKINKNHKNQKY